MEEFICEIKYLIEESGKNVHLRKRLDDYDARLTVGLFDVHGVNIWERLNLHVHNLKHEAYRTTLLEDILEVLQGR